MKLRILRICPTSLAVTFGVIYFIIGLLVGLFGVLAAMSGSQFTMSGPVSFSGAGMSMLPLAVAYPFLASLMGAIGGYLIAWVYNFSVRFTRGIQLDFSEPTNREY
jgi:prepilin signal peptidase PulO-like enzyme (type II secretory pathway)